jgi:glycosyltransferase involved in cell wall biosynthesis
MTRVSAIVITLDEADRIAETISSICFCDEVLVVDCGSTDGTREIAAQCGARVLERTWTGYSDQKNFAAANASNDWVFSVDADERPSIELANEIVRWKVHSGEPAFRAYSMPRRVCYLGVWIRHSGWYPDAKTRLYDRRLARWTGGFVHERLDIEGRTGAFRADLLHFPYRTPQEHRETIDRYTRLAAAEAQNRGRGFNPARLIFGPPLYFLKTFVLRAGFLDGRAGLRIAVMGARYVLIREFRILRGWS